MTACLARILYLRTNMKRRKKSVVITGIGIVSPIGIGKAAFWENLLAGKSGFDWIKNMDASTYPSRMAAEVRDFDPASYLTPRQIRYLSRGAQFACAAYKMAIEDSNLQDNDLYRTDVIMGCATSSFSIIEEQLDRSSTSLRQYERGEVDPTGMIKAFIFAPAAAVANMAKAKGYVSTVSSACASGLNAVGTAAKRILNSEADVVIAGGTDTPINRFVFSGMCAAQMLNTNQDDPKTAVKPFDLNRTKQALGEGAVVFILEEKKHAIERQAHIYGEIVSFSHTTENINELFMLDGSGTRWSETLQSACGDQAQKVAHVNAHAPGDKDIDKAEAIALAKTFGNRVGKIPVTSIKGAVGQGLSSAGMFQLASAVLALKSKEIPPTRNYQTPDPEIGLKVLTRRQKFKGTHILVSGHAVGGINSAILLKEFAI